MQLMKQSRKEMDEALEAANLAMQRSSLRSSLDAKQQRGARGSTARTKLTRGGLDQMRKALWEQEQEAERQRQRDAAAARRREREAAQEAARQALKAEEPEEEPGG